MQKRPVLWLCTIAMALILSIAPNGYAQKKARSKSGTPLPSSGVVSCEVAAKRAFLPDLPEASGVAKSVTRPDILWTMTDSKSVGNVIGLDLSGTVKETVRVSGIKPVDWEDISVGKCEAGSCVYVADIGDNNAKRKDISVYRFPEPAPGVSEVEAERFRATYPDGPHDAESLFLDPAGQMFIVTKGPGSVALYKFPASARPGQPPVQLERIGEPRPIGQGERITAAAASRDGQWVVTRTHNVLSFYRLQEFEQGKWNEVGHVNVDPLREQQGEGVSFSETDAIYLVSEGGGKPRPGILNTISCEFSK